jgi:ubiquinone/menaquinone biosynthesis C-methylase UbiE
MKRIPEPELMNDKEQAEAYASADFENANSLFLDLFKERFSEEPTPETILDLGCGPGDIMFKFASTFPETLIHGVDGAEEMMDRGKKRIGEQTGLSERLQFINGFIPGLELPLQNYDAIISNSLLHHLHEPLYLWQTIKRFSQPGSVIFIMDLNRPDDRETAKNIVNQYSATEPTVLRMDFYNSLLAAFTPAEINEQLKQEELDYLKTEVVSDRHLLVWGKIK